MLRLACSLVATILLAGCVAQFPREPTAKNSFAFAAEPAEIVGDWFARKGGGFDETQLVCDGRLFVNGRSVLVEPGTRVLTVSYWGNRGQTFMFYRSPRQSARVALRPGGRYLLRGHFEDRHVQMSLVALPEQRVVVEFPRVDLQEHKSGGMGRIPAPCDRLDFSQIGASRLTDEVRRAFRIPAGIDSAIVFMNPASEQRYHDHRFFVDGSAVEPLRPGQFVVVPAAPGERVIAIGNSSGLATRVAVNRGDAVFALVRTQQLMAGPSMVLTGAGPSLIPGSANDVFWDFVSAPAAVSMARDLRSWEAAPPR